MTTQIIHTDILSFCSIYKGPKFHALLCDPPYELGFMGKAWDKSGIVFDPATWEAITSHLLPGAFGMAFASSRGWHRLACAIEDAGLRIHPSIFGWVFGSGFPKATRIDTQIDKMGGRGGYEKDRRALAAHIREKRTTAGISVKEMASWFRHKEVTKNWERQDGGGRWPSHNDYGVLVERLGCSVKYRDVIRAEEARQVIARSDNGIAGGTKQHTGEDDAWGFGREFDITAPSTDLARAWTGHRYGLQALKPALEPIIVFQKPYEGKPVESITKTGAGALNIDGGRIGTEILPECRAGQAQIGTFERTDMVTPERQGRWPANFYLDEEAAKRLGKQSGDTSSSRSNGNPNDPVHQKLPGQLMSWGGKRTTHDFRDTGTAARFFFNVNRQIDEADPVLYCAKASRKERDTGLSGIIDRLGGSLDGGNDTRHGQDKPQLRMVKNPHPTVKPIDLARWLAALLLPPAEYAPRRILVPFSGSGSEMIGAYLASWEEIVGIEMEQEYIEIAEARLKHWTANKGFIERSLIDDNEPCY